MGNAIVLLAVAAAIAFTWWDNARVRQRVEENMRAISALMRAIDAYQENSSERTAALNRAADSAEAVRAELERHRTGQ